MKFSLTLNVTESIGGGGLEVVSILSYTNGNEKWDDANKTVIPNDLVFSRLQEISNNRLGDLCRKIQKRKGEL